MQASGATAPAARTILRKHLQNNNYTGGSTSKYRGAAAAFTKRLELIGNAGLWIGHDESKPAAIPHGAPRDVTLTCVCKPPILNLPQILWLTHSVTRHLKPMRHSKILQQRIVCWTLLLSRRASEYCELRVGPLHFLLFRALDEPSRTGLRKQGREQKTPGIFKFRFTKCYKYCLFFDLKVL